MVFNNYGPVKQTNSSVKKLIENILHIPKEFRQ